MTANHVASRLEDVFAAAQKDHDEWPDWMKQAAYFDGTSHDQKQSDDQSPMNEDEN